VLLAVQKGLVSLLSLTKAQWKPRSHFPAKNWTDVHFVLTEQQASPAPVATAVDLAIEMVVATAVPHVATNRLLMCKKPPPGGFFFA
jgi:hypothetical protein